MRNPERFTTFVLGTIVFVYYIGITVQAFRVRKNIGRSPIVAFSAGGTGNALKAVEVFTIPIPVFVWAWCPSCFRTLEIASLQHWRFRMIGLLALCAGLSIGYLSFMELGNQWRIGSDSTAAVQSVRTGIYSAIRHPFYGSFILGLAGIFLMAPNWLFAAIFVLATAIIPIQVRAEEKFLRRSLP